MEREELLAAEAAHAAALINYEICTKAMDAAAEAAEADNSKQHLFAIAEIAWEAAADDMDSTSRTYDHAYKLWSITDADD